MKLSAIKSNPDNPRVIKDENYERLKKNIQEFPKMLALRPIIISEDNVVLGGNQRLKALRDLGYKEVPKEWVKKASDLTDEEKERFVISDNGTFGEWDYESLSSWEKDKLIAWGADIDEWEDFKPNLDPHSDVSDVTKEQIEAEAKRLAGAIVNSKMKKEVICPECGHEFEIDG